MTQLSDWIVGAIFVWLFLAVVVGVWVSKILAQIDPEDY